MMQQDDSNALLLAVQAYIAERAHSVRPCQLEQVGNLALSLPTHLAARSNQPDDATI